MPQQYNPSGQDWAPVNAGKSLGTGPKASVVPKTARQLDLAKAAGLVTTEKRYAAGTNKSSHTAASLQAKKLEEATDVGSIARVDKQLSQAIMQARTIKKLSQKDLATLVNEKVQVIAEYESGKAIPNSAIIVKLERALGTKLPRPGKPIKIPNEAKPATAAGAAAGVKKPAGATGAVVRGGPPKRR
jgi:putative transcription factor